MGLVPLPASATEIMYALGLRDDLAGLRRASYFPDKQELNLPAVVPRGASGRYAWSAADAADPLRSGGRAMRGRHESPRRDTDMFMALVVLALLAILAAVLGAALTGG